jgi:hypothetical protein
MERIALPDKMQDLRNEKKGEILRGHKKIRDCSSVIRIIFSTFLVAIIFIFFLLTIIGLK